MNNKSQPLSLWSCFYPRSKMNWSWDSGSDNRVSQMWMLMKKLSDCREVIYSKWYQGRATFFSVELFTALLSFYFKNLQASSVLSKTAKNLLEILENDSPLSTKQLKKLAELQGKDNEKEYSQAMKSLFKNFLVVAYGEVDDGAFPSLAVGSTQHIYEEIWTNALKMNSSETKTILNNFIPEFHLFQKYLLK